MATSAKLLIHPIRDVTIVNFQETSILDTAQVEQIGEELYHLVDAKNCRKLILDFTKVKFLSSSALGILITLHKKSAGIKGKLVLCSLRPDLKKVFDITRLDKIFKFCANEEEALSIFGVTSGG